MNIRSTMALIIAECERIKELIIDAEDSINKRGQIDPYYKPHIAELKNKMHELRRDCLRLEKQIYSNGE